MKTALEKYAGLYDAIRCNEVVFLFGTGISSALTGKPYGWKKWLEDGIALLKDRALAKTLVDTLKEDDSTSGMIAVAGRLMASAKHDGTYPYWMRASFERNAIINRELCNTLRMLARSQSVFATTNYDLLLEQASGLGTLSYDSPDVAFEMLDKRLSTHVLHIHGVYDSEHAIDDIIADDRQYKRISADKGAQFIQGILGTRTLILVGCGKTTEDANVSRFIEFANRHLKMDREYYYLYNSENPTGELPDFIRPVPYGNSYDDLPLFLEDIARTRLQAKTAGNAIVGLNPYESVAAASDSLLKYHFSHRCIPFCGRKEELSALTAFVMQNTEFSWWAVTGQAGSGKSRLALELIHALPSTWFGFFLKDGFCQRDLEAFEPFCHTLVVMDYVAGRERAVATAIYRLKERFSTTSYQIRILLLERDNSRTTGSWYSKLLQRLNRSESEEIVRAEYADAFLDLEDMKRSDVEAFIAAVCASKGCSGDCVSELYEAYGRKFERLRYRPLYLQLYVEAWIDHDFVIPQYDSYAQLLEFVLKREQQRWITAVEGSQKVCNALVRLMIRANIAGRLDLAEVPDLYAPDWATVSAYMKAHSFAGRQRQEAQDNLINSFCQNIDREHAILAPQFPDIIKEYMFAYYTDEGFLPQMMKEIWQHASSAFSTFIMRCMMDFPQERFFTDAVNAYQASTYDLEVLIGRLGMLSNRLIQKGEDPRVYWNVIDNEHVFWSSIRVPEECDERAETIASIKISGLYKVAQHIGAWSLYDLAEMESVIQEMLEVKGGKIADVMKKHYLQDHLTALSKGGFYDEAEKIREKLSAMVADGEDTYNALLTMENDNTSMVEALFTGNFQKAKRVFLRMVEKCNYQELQCVQLLAHSCFNVEHLSLMLDGKEISGIGCPVAVNCAERFPDDWAIRARRIGCQASLLQGEIMKNRIPEQELRRRVSELEVEMSTMRFNGSESDEALEMTWSIVKTMRFNFATEEELRSIAAEADGILETFPRYTSVAQARIIATMALYRRFIHKKVPHEEVERLYKLVETNPESETVRGAFFEMLNESVDAHNKEDFYNADIIREAIQDARYNPISDSGIDEIDALYGGFAGVQSPVIRKPKVGRNDPCPCGSGKKFKKCCWGKGVYD